MENLGKWLGSGVVALLMVPVGSAIAQDDLAASGESVFKARCKVCHTAEADAKHKIGPNLFGVMGQSAGWQESFRYSKGHRDSGATWDDATMNLYLEDISQVAPKSVKRFAGLSKPDDRAAVIAYLNTLK